MLPVSPSGRGNSPRLAALLPLGKRNFDPIRSTIRALIQHDLGLPWGNFGSNCVKVLLAEATIVVFEHTPGGERELWERIGPTVVLKRERLPQGDLQWEKGSSAPSVRIRIQRWSFSLSSLFLNWFLLFFFFFCSFEELVLLTSAGTGSY